MSRPYLLFWWSWFVIGAAYEVWAVWFHPSRDDTLSEWFATTFRTGTTTGWWVLMALIGTVAVWFPGHTRRLAQRPPVTVVVVKSDADHQP